jgi:diaminopropionate ammonia-lyase
MTRVWQNQTLRDLPPTCPAARAFHRRLPGYEPTPLRELAGLAASVGVRSVLIKDESERLGLPAFKVLGAIWAVYRELERALGPAIHAWSSLDDLARRIEPLRPLRLLAATDGNHGRAVARVARLLDLEATIFLPLGAAQARIVAIEDEGAAVEVVDGTYDDAIAQATALRDDHAWLIQDTAFRGYERIPADVVDGYSTIFSEAREQAPCEIDVALVQVGVGSLASAAVLDLGPKTRVVGVEPERAACGLAALETGRVVTISGPHDSIMAGLNCGTLSTTAFPVLRDGLAGMVAIEDRWAEEAMRRLAAENVRAGETGAAGVAALLALADASEGTRAALGLGPDACVLLISTEGPTDPASYARIVGEVAASGERPP